MSALVYRISRLISQALAHVPVGTNLGLLHLLFALLSGRFLATRGAVFPALANLGLPDADVRRSEAALCYGRWHTADLLADWRKAVAQEGRFAPCVYEGVRPVACDLAAFFRPRLRELGSKHYASDAGKALPALVFGLCAAVGSAGQTRWALPRFVLRREPGQSEADLQRCLLMQAAQELASDEALVVDAGFGLADLLNRPSLSFVCRVRSNQTARRSVLPAYQGRGRRPQRGLLVRPLSRTRAGRTIPATPPDATAHWQDGCHRLRAEMWHGLVQTDQLPGASCFRLVAIHDPRYREPLLLASNLDVSASALWRLYQDRWAIEQLPLSAKPMLGAERAWVFGTESRYRLPELALLAGSLLSYVAATSAPVASGFWDRAARPTCGRLRRVLSRVHSADLPVHSADLPVHSADLPVHSADLSALPGQLRKKNSVTAHLKTGVEAHRRHKPEPGPSQAVQSA